MTDDIMNLRARGEDSGSGDTPKEQGSDIAIHGARSVNDGSAQHKRI